MARNIVFFLPQQQASLTTLIPIPPKPTSSTYVIICLYRDLSQEFHIPPDTIQPVLNCVLCARRFRFMRETDMKSPTLFTSLGIWVFVLFIFCIFKNPHLSALPYLFSVSRLPLLRIWVFVKFKYSVHVTWSFSVWISKSVVFQDWCKRDQRELLKDLLWSLTCNEWKLMQHLGRPHLARTTPPQPLPSQGWHVTESWVLEWRLAQTVGRAGCFP